MDADDPIVFSRHFTDGQAVRGVIRRTSFRVLARAATATGHYGSVGRRLAGEFRRRLVQRQHIAAQHVAQMAVLADQMLVPLVEKPRFEAERFQFGYAVATVGIDAPQRGRLNQVRKPCNGHLDSPDRRLDALNRADEVGGSRDGLLRHPALYMALRKPSRPTTRLWRIAGDELSIRRENLNHLNEAGVWAPAIDLK